MSVERLQFQYRQVLYQIPSNEHRSMLRRSMNVKGRGSDRKLKE